MIELGQLEKQHAAFESRHVRLIVSSLEDVPTAALSQAAFPHLEVLADAGRGLSNPLQVIHPQSGPGGIDTSAPTTILIDGDGIVRWIFRPERHIVRLSPAELLAAVDDHLLKK